MTQSVSDRVVRQRIRNRVIEDLELQASFELQRDYEARVPVISAGEVIEGWHAWIYGDPRHETPHAVLTLDDIAALAPVHDCIEAAAMELRQFDYPTMAQAQGLPAWTLLQNQSAIALAVLSQRGRMSGDAEEDQACLAHRYASRRCATVTISMTSTSSRMR